MNTYTAGDQPETRRKVVIAGEKSSNEAEEEERGGRGPVNYKQKERR